MTTNFHALAVDNTGLDPLQGFDFEIWVQYSDDGSLAFVGAFQSITTSFRNATETYLELGQRIPIYLDGEFQIAWVLEQGLVDAFFAVNTFGGPNIRRDQFIGRSPRFHISFDMNAYQLEAAETRGRQEPNSIVRAGSLNAATFNPVNGAIEAGTFKGGINQQGRKSQGRYELMRCKVDSVSMGAMAGRKVAALRWEGVSEGYTFVDRSARGTNQFNATTGGQGLLNLSKDLQTGGTRANSGGGISASNTLSGNAGNPNSPTG